MLILDSVACAKGKIQEKVTEMVFSFTHHCILRLIINHYLSIGYHDILQ